MLVPDSLLAGVDEIGLGAGELLGDRSFLRALRLDPGMMVKIQDCGCLRSSLQADDSVLQPISESVMVLVGFFYGRGPVDR
jgi:hypothetical protein